ncbi:hypothetical protein FB451DRAFT_1560948 [Mycena latifolia]|nr:hypothetical protein FB451DRAFT_1560948 [Mycena latifolia]
MTRAPAQHLPPEVVDFVMDGNRGDRKTLSSCSLVCKAWLQSSRYCLFSEFDVYVGPTVGASFLKLLIHPLCTIIYCIRSISIYPGLPGRDDVASLGDTTVTGLAKLKHVASLRIHNHRGRVPKATLDLLASTFNEVSTLRMSNQFPSFNDAVEFVAMFPALETLVFYPWCINAAPTTAPETCLPSTLRSLYLHSPFTHGPWFSEHHNRLQSLTLSTIQPTDIERVKDMLTAFGSDLRHFSIAFPRGPQWPLDSDQHQCARDFSAKVDYLCNPRLSSLEIKIPGDSSQILLSILQSMRTPNLERLTWETGGLKHVREWEKVDARVADRVAFKCLKQLQVVVDERLPGPPNYSPIPVPPPIRNRLPKADALGIEITEQRC